MVARWSTWIRRQCREHVAEVVILLLAGIGTVLTAGMAAAGGWAWSVHGMLSAMQSDHRSVLGRLEATEQDSAKQWVSIDKHADLLSIHGERLGKVETRVEGISRPTQ